MNRHLAFKILWVGLLLTLAGFLAVGAVKAQARAATLDWKVISAGGIGTSGGDVVITSTLGQPIAGPTSGGAVDHQAGFWVHMAAALFDLFLPLFVR